MTVICIWLYISRITCLGESFHCLKCKKYALLLKCLSSHWQVGQIWGPYSKDLSFTLLQGMLPLKLFCWTRLFLKIVLCWIDSIKKSPLSWNAARSFLCITNNENEKKWTILGHDTLSTITKQWSACIMIYLKLSVLILNKGHYKRKLSKTLKREQLIVAANWCENNTSFYAEFLCNMSENHFWLLMTMCLLQIILTLKSSIHKGMKTFYFPSKWLNNCPMTVKDLQEMCLLCQ